MDLQISLFLLFLVFTAGQSLSCYQCAGFCTQTTCNSGFSSCFSLTAYYGGTQAVLKGCAPGTVCPSGSVNLGSLKVSSSCCDTDLCNAQDAPDPNTATPNGLKCYYCDGKSCSKTLNCSGTEDRCMTETGTIGTESLVFKGCVSNSFCNVPASIPLLSNFTCCEGNLCNGVNRASRSFLFLCCSLLSFIILH